MKRYCQHIQTVTEAGSEMHIEAGSKDVQKERYRQTANDRVTDEQ